ncbi:MAG: ATP-binding cassette domain-containing protein, partial [Geminicoccaceae bacterium]|nr:ATP-binding cassette domain-containing protein [Geminicoccaceae bacterium]
RKFQKPTVFDRLTVEENLELATQGGWGVRRLLAGRLEPEAAERIERTLATVGLAELRHEEAGRLAHGQRQWLEIGMLLVQEPRLILLDEPVAGMSDAETAKTAELILRLKGRHTIVVVEHDMHFVRELGAKVTVLHEGRVLAEGPVEAVQSDPAVVEVYLGRS